MIAGFELLPQERVHLIGTTCRSRLIEIEGRLWLLDQNRCLRRGRSEEALEAGNSCVQYSIQYSHTNDRSRWASEFFWTGPNPVESLLGTIRLRFGGLSDDTISKHTEILHNLRIRRV